MLIAGLILGMIIGAAIGYLYAGRRLGAATERTRAAEDRAALVDGQLAERFQSLSAQALDASTARFLEIAEGRLRAENVKAAGELDNRRAAVEHLVGPLRSFSGTPWRSDLLKIGKGSHAPGPACQQGNSRGGCKNGAT